MKRGFKTQAEQQARDYRQALAIHDSQPLPAKSLAGHLGIHVMTPDEIPGLDSLYSGQLSNRNSKWSAAAVVIPEQNREFIIYNSAHSRPRQESDIMHEIAHIICKHAAVNSEINGSLRSYDKEQEEEARYMGACLQITRVGLLWALRRGMTREQIAKHFLASIDLVRYRQNVPGADKQIARERARRPRWAKAR